MARQIFPTAQEVKKHKHVIFFTCTLMVQPDVLLELVCSKLLIEFQQVSCKISKKSEIKSSLSGLKLLVNLHAEICVTKLKSFVWTGQKVGAVLGPKKLCVCTSAADDLLLKSQSSTGCALVVSGLYELKKFTELCMNYHCESNLVLSSLCLVVDLSDGVVVEDEASAITKVVSQNFQLPQNVSLAKIKNCSLPKAAYNYIAQQFSNGDKFRMVKFGGVGRFAYRDNPGHFKNAFA